MAYDLTVQERNVEVKVEVKDVDSFCTLEIWFGKDQQTRWSIFTSPPDELESDVKNVTPVELAEQLEAGAVALREWQQKYDARKAS